MQMHNIAIGCVIFAADVPSEYQNEVNTFQAEGTVFAIFDRGEPGCFHC